MHLFLNLPRAIWGIPGTDIFLSRSSPFKELSEENVASLTAEQKKILDLAVQWGVISVVKSDFAPAAGIDPSVAFILDRPVLEIHRCHVAKMRFAKDVRGLENLRAGEVARENPRAVVLTVIDRALADLKGESGVESVPEIIAPEPPRTEEMPPKKAKRPRIETSKPQQA